uniref:Uncharacterized protein n=1 Tax=Trichogramma kaykai TaxID=54128 RepID=A0ABD2X4V8_9HYME
MENRKNSVSIKEEPFDDWSGVGDNPDDQVDSCTAENFEYQLTINKPSANDMNESMPLEEGREEIILVDFDSKNFPKIPLDNPIEQLNCFFNYMLLIGLPTESPRLETKIILIPYTDLPQLIFHSHARKDLKFAKVDKKALSLLVNI